MAFSPAEFSCTGNELDDFHMSTKGDAGRLKCIPQIFLERVCKHTDKYVY
jgi:hypothetical protein